MMLTVWSGLSLGAIYVIVAVGFNVVFVASGSFNFAQPQYLMLGTFIAYWVATTLGLDPLVAVVVGAVVGATVGVLEERVAVRPIAGTSVHGELVTTVGWSVMMQGAVLLIWGSQPLPVQGVVPDDVVELLGGRVSITELVLIALAIVLAVGFHVWSRTTLNGIASLASAEDPQAAVLRGVNIKRLSTVAFAVAGALLASLGPFVGPKTYALFSIGSIVVLKSFFAMAIGGFGSNIGAMVGGFGLGLTEAFTNRYLGSEYVNPVLFVLLMVLLFVWPHGIFGQRVGRVV
jgi:branched-chain amino acid transport system permease protein